MTDRTELRRLLDDSNVASPGPWRRIGQRVDDRDRFEVGSFICEQDAQLIAAAVNALPSLLDQLDAAEDALNDAILYENEGRDALARQTPLYLAAEAALARVRELHYPADNDPTRTPVCKDCHGKAGTHPCGCWADVDREPVCGHCREGHKGMSVAWPCPTIAAIGGEQS